jgi:hypothetical protein
VKAGVCLFLNKLNLHVKAILPLPGADDEEDIIFRELNLIGNFVFE